MNTEPAAIGAALAAVLQVLALLIFDLSQEAQAAIVVAVTLVVGLFVRSQVTPVP